MKFTEIKLRSNFVFREEEKKKIQALARQAQPQILAVYGRRRVGKSELIANALADRSVLKIEGIQGVNEEQQIDRAKKQLSISLEDPDIRNITMDSWFDFFDLFVRKADFSQPFSLYLEEVQWLANYSSTFISDLKFYWDNHLQYKQGLFLVLCGSSASFIANEVLNSAALYNRSQHYINLQPFTFVETKKFLGQHTALQAMDVYLTLGGIPEYLNYVKDEKSTFLGICKHSFNKDGFFTKEHQRIFVSSLKENKNYQKIIELLAQRRFASRSDILKIIK